MALLVLNLQRRVTPSADGTTELILEPLPLYGLMIHIEASATGANTAPNATDLLAMITNIQLMLAGTTLFQASLTDAAWLSSVIARTPPYYLQNAKANNDLAQITVFIPLSRTPGNPNWALPATAAGQLRLQLTQDIAVGSYDTLTWDIDAIHDDSAQPTGFLRTTTLQRTAPATGDLDIDLPVGRKLMGIGVFSTTERVTEAGASGVRRIKLLRDSTEAMYSSAEWATIQQLGRMMKPPTLSMMDHLHTSDVAAAYTQFQDTQAQRIVRGGGFSQGWVELDPLGDQSQGLDLTSCNRAVLRCTMDTAEALRLLPVEWWQTGQGGPIVTQ